MSHHRHSEHHGYPDSNSSGSPPMATNYNNYDYSHQRHYSSGGKTNGKRTTSALHYDSDQRNDSDNSLSDLETNDFDINDEIAQYMVDLKVRHKKLVDRINKFEKKKQKTLHRELQSRYNELARFSFTTCFRNSKEELTESISQQFHHRNGSQPYLVKSLAGLSDPQYPHSSHLTSVTDKPSMRAGNHSSHRVSAYASNSQMYNIQNLSADTIKVEPELTFDQAWQKTHETISEKQDKFQLYYKEKKKLAYKIALLCARQVKSLQKRKQQISRLAYPRANQATREMLAYWKANEREERELRKRAERDALIKAKQEEEKREKMQQSRKLNFLLTQTELFSHFVSKKIQPESNQAGDSTPGEPREVSVATPTESNPILATDDLDSKSINDDEAQPLDLQDIDFDADDDEVLKQKALQGAQHAIQTQLEQTRQFDEGSKQRRAEAHAEQTGEDAADVDFMNPSSLRTDFNVEQPKILICQLKNYQLKGLNWLANLYELGINGILADEMGLGKTVQAISLLAYLAETHGIWGPFIVITPASTLHNWSDELQKFVPSFKVLPYWGSVKDRTILRQDWSKKKLYSKDAPFHILVTSYQMILTDEKYLARIKWQYMVLDEAQAIKSSSSSRWKTLRKFNCRNRLLLTGTPIQNNMQELWALLNFIMPSLFDSHEEFSEWFSKDIENHAENKGTLNEHQVKRLHMILKPFMLRRVKRSVQNELPEKVELEIMCDLTTRQQKLYAGLKENMSLSFLLEKSKSLTDKENVDSLMNLVMQLRKVCNHPELFKRAEIESSFAFSKYQSGNHIYDNYVSYVTKSPIEIRLPSFFDNEPCLIENSSKSLRHKLLYKTLNIWSEDFIYRSQYEADGVFSFLSHTAQSPSVTSGVHTGKVEALYQHHYAHEHHKDLLFNSSWDSDENSGDYHADNLEILTPEDLIKRSSLNSIQATQEFEKSIVIPGIKQCYLHPAIAPPVSVISNDVNYNKSHNDNLFYPLYQQLLVADTPLLNPYIRDADRLPSSFQDDEAFSSVHVPNPEKLVLECGKLKKLDEMLPKLKAGGHRILMYFQMTKMIDIVEEYLSYRNYSFLRLDGSSKISDRRDMVNDWQTCPELFIFLLSTRAGGLGINLTAADTVIFYDSDWNPTVDQQAMDRAHRLGQTRQVTVYRMVTRNSIEERILERARQKDEIHRVVISGGEAKPLDFKPKEIVSLLLDDQAPEPNRSPMLQETGNAKTSNDNNGALSTPSASNGSKRSVDIDDLLSPCNDIKKPKVEEIFP